MQAAPPPAAPQPPPPPWTQERWSRKLVHVKGSQVNPSFLGHALLSITIIGLAILSYKLVLDNVFRKADEWKICSQIPKQNPGKESAASTDDSPLNIEQVKKNIDDLGAVNSNDAIAQRVRLSTQVEQLNQAQRTACTIGIYFFANRTATSTIATAAGIASIASLAFVSKRGWEHSNNTIINIGVTSGLILFSTWTFSQLYGQGSNFENQRTKQNLAINLLNRVASASANRSAEILIPGAKDPGKEVVNLNTASGLQKFIQSLDTDLQTLHKLDFGLDETFARSAVFKIAPFFPVEQSPKPPDAVPSVPPTTSSPARK